MGNNEPNPDDKKYVPAFRTEGSIYFSGSARRSDVPYSRNTLIFGAILVACLVLFIAWVTLSMIGIV